MVPIWPERRKIRRLGVGYVTARTRQVLRWGRARCPTGPLRLLWRWRGHARVGPIRLGNVCGRRRADPFDDHLP